MTSSDPRGSVPRPAGTDPLSTAGSPGTRGTAAHPTAATPESSPRRGREGQGSARRAGRALGFGLAAALLVFVTVVLVLFVLFNTQTVDVSLVFGNVQLPLVLALVFAAVLGGLVVGLAALAARARRRG